MAQGGRVKRRAQEAAELGKSRGCPELKEHRARERALGGAAAAAAAARGELGQQGREWE